MPPRSARKTAVAKRRTRASATRKPASKPTPSPEAEEEIANGGGAVQASAEEASAASEVSTLMAPVDEVKPLVSEPDEGLAVVGVIGQEEEASTQALEDSVMEEASGRDEEIAVVGVIGQGEEAPARALEEPAVEEVSGRDEVVAQAENEVVAEEEEEDPSMVEEEAAQVEEQKEDEEDPVEVEEEAAPVGEQNEDEEDPVEVEEEAVQDGEQEHEGDEDPVEVEEEIALGGDDEEEEEEEEPSEDPQFLERPEEDGEEVAKKKPMVDGNDGATGGDAAKDKGVDGLTDDDDSRSDDDDADNEEVDPSLYMHEQRLERKKKEVDIFIGGLAKDAVEDDILKVFGAFGEIQSVRIVKSHTTQKSKGFAFIRYATAEAAKKALTELKDGTEVVETLKGFGIEGVEHLLLPDDPNNKGKSRGFAFLEFSSHSDAMAAFQRLRKPDAVLGCDRSAKVSFAQTPINPSEELLLQVKTVYIENVPASWDEGTIKGFCEQYGKIDKVQVFRKNHTGKKKEFAFVEFASRESALVCVEGINNSQIGEGDVKVSANLAKPLNKGRLAKQGIRGGFKIRKGGEAAKKTSQPKKVNNKKSKAVLIKENAYPKKFGNKPSSFQNKGTKRKNGPPIARPIIIRDKKDGRRGSDNFKERPLKKSRRNHDFQPRPSKGFGNQRVGYAGHPIVHPTVHTPRYATNATSYSGYGHAGASGSNLRHADLEPHAGYLPARNIPTNYGYEQRRPNTYNSHQRGGAAFAGAPTVTQTSYPGDTNYAGYQAGGYACPPPPGGAYPGSSGPYPPRRAYY